MIRNLRMYPIFTSKGTPSVKVKVVTDDGSYSASVPSGTSTGKHEAVELPVARVLKFFSKVRPMFVGLDENDWEAVDSMLEKMDGSPDFRNLGENLALGISLAVARASKKSELWKLESPGLTAKFPFPVGNVVGGGSHGGGSDWQEFLLIPYRAKTPYQAVESLTNAWIQVAHELKDRKLLRGRNVENAWMCLMGNEKTLEFLAEFASEWDMKLGIDFASSELWDGKAYKYTKAKKAFKPSQHAEYIEELAKSYGLYYLEDPCHQDDFRQHRVLTHSLGKQALVVGDDLYCTSRSRLKKGIQNQSTNSILVKPNQTGTLRRTREVVKLARDSGFSIVPSHRSGETDDDWLADLAVAWEAPLIKAGVTGLDVPKLNRLLELWEEVPRANMAEMPV
jgi:enolase